MRRRGGYRGFDIGYIYYNYIYWTVIAILKEYMGLARSEFWASLSLNLSGPML
jgi:hypothetical protein